MEGHRSFHLLHDLMNVSVEDRYRSEALEQRKDLRTIVGTPTPVGIDRP